MTHYVWTRNNKLGVDTIHRADCRHNLLPDRHSGAEPIKVSGETLEEAQRYIAESMGWGNWPDESPYEFEIQIAPCAR